MKAFLKFAVRAAIVVFPLALIVTLIWYMNTELHMSAQEIAQTTVRRGRSRNAPLPMVLLEAAFSVGIITYTVILGIYALFHRRQASSILESAAQTDSAWKAVQGEVGAFEETICRFIESENSYDVESIQPFVTEKLLKTTSTYYAKMRSKNICIHNSEIRIRDTDIVVAQDHKDDKLDRVALKVKLQYLYKWFSSRTGDVIHSNQDSTYQTLIYWFVRKDNRWLLDELETESLGLYEREKSIMEE